MKKKLKIITHWRHGRHTLGAKGLTSQLNLINCIPDSKSCGCKDNVYIGSDLPRFPRFGILEKPRLKITKVTTQPKEGSREREQENIGQLV